MKRQPKPRQAMPALTGQPSPEFRRHHEIEAPQIDTRAFRQGWRIRTRLDVLYIDGKLTGDEYQAAHEYRTAHYKLERQATELLGGRASSRGDPHARMAAQLEIRTRITQADAQLTANQRALAYACAVEDVSWYVLGKLFGCKHTTAQKRAVEALQALALAWAAKVAAGRSRRRVRPS